MRSAISHFPLLTPPACEGWRFPASHSNDARYGVWKDHEFAIERHIRPYNFAEDRMHSGRNFRYQLHNLSQFAACIRSIAKDGQRYK